MHEAAHHVLDHSLYTTALLRYQYCEGMNSQYPVYCATFRLSNLCNCTHESSHIQNIQLCYQEFKMLTACTAVQMSEQIINC